MFVTVNMSKKGNGEAGAFVSNMIPVLSLLLIGYPVARATVRAMLIGWILVVLSAARSIWRYRFQTTGGRPSL